jgi:hypothetical protein
VSGQLHAPAALLLEFLDRLYDYQEGNEHPVEWNFFSGISRKIIVGSTETQTIC